MQNTTNHAILLVEDSPSDAHLAQRAFAESRYASHVSHARDGVEAMEMLRREGPHANFRRPDLILLDLNMPRKDGRQVLIELKQDEQLRRIPVVVLTTSADDQDVAEAYRLGSNSYIVKPVDLKAFFQLVEHTEQYWFDTCRLPDAGVQG